MGPARALSPPTALREVVNAPQAASSVTEQALREQVAALKKELLQHQQLQAAAQAQLGEVRAQNGQLHSLLSTVEKERDFYWKHLREIEIWCDQQTNPDPISARCIKSVQEILYKPDA